MQINRRRSRPDQIPNARGVQITSHSPTGTAVPTSTIVTVVFAQAMNAGSITASSFTLTGPGGSVAGTVAYAADTRTATFKPAHALANSTTYTIGLTTAIADSSGNHLGSPVTWTFRTVARRVPGWYPGLNRVYRRQ
jgi:Bacterial Ig-like domain